jgi:hypothetical protein
MPITEADWRASRAQQAQATPRPIQETLLRQAAVESSRLTGHPAWDTYLQRLQVDLEEAEASLLTWQQKVAGAYADADLRMVQVQVNILTDRIATLRHCMALPQEILTHASTALDSADK